MLAACGDSPAVETRERELSSRAAELGWVSSQQVLQGTGRPSVTIKGVGPWRSQ